MQPHHTTPLSKICPRCYIEQPLGDFGRNRSSRTGYGSYCKRCNREYRVAYQQAHPDYEKESKRAWREAHPAKTTLSITERLAQTQREWNTPVPWP